MPGTPYSVTVSDAAQPDQRFSLDDGLVDKLFRRTGNRLRHKVQAVRQEIGEVENVIDHVFGDIRSLDHSLDRHLEDDDQDHKHGHRSWQAVAADEYYGTIAEDALELEANLLDWR